MPSSTVENYLKCIFIEQQRTETRLVAMGRLAHALALAPGTITSMVKTLDEAGLVQYEPRGGVSLTEHGERLALRVLRRHRLVELFLVKFLGLDWSEVHEEAEELEHVISDKVLDRIDSLLGHPSVDPHGDPIPSAKGKLVMPTLTSLAECHPRQPLRIARVLNQDPEFLQFLDRSGLTPGSQAVLLQHDKPADAITVQPADLPAVTIGVSAAAKILVELTGSSALGQTDEDVPV